MINLNLFFFDNLKIDLVLLNSPRNICEVSPSLICSMTLKS